MFGWLKARRRRRILARERIPDARWSRLIAAVPSLRALSPDEQATLRRHALVLLHEKRFEAAGGLALDDDMRLRIAALAAVPILELGLDAYHRFRTFVVHPAEFVARGREEIDEAGVVHVSDEVMSGEAWESGPVVLAWEDVEASGQGDGYDVVAHELAHQLDMLDGAVNGMPPLHAGMDPEAWAAAFQAAFDAHARNVERGVDTWLDPYAAENPGEFFAVCSEMFFDVPDELCAGYPAVYQQLALFYRRSPATRYRAVGGTART